MGQEEHYEDLMDSITPTMTQDRDQKITHMLATAGWLCLSYGAELPPKAFAVALQNVPLGRGYGVADFILFVEGRAAGVIELSARGEAIQGLSADIEKYRRGLPFSLRLYVRPLPFLYQTTGEVTFFTMGFDVSPDPRRVFSFHRPETLKRWLEDGMVGETPRDMAAEHFPEYRRRGRSFHERLLINMPALEDPGLSRIEGNAILRLEEALKQYQGQVLIEMASDVLREIALSHLLFRVVRYADACRVLVLLGSESEAEKTLEALKQLWTSQMRSERSEKDVFQEGLSVAPGVETRFCFFVLPEVFDAGFVDRVAGLNIPIEAFDLLVLENGNTLSEGQRAMLVSVKSYFDAVLLGLTEKTTTVLAACFEGKVLKEDLFGQAEADGLGMMT